MKKYLVQPDDLERRDATEALPLWLIELENWAPESSLGVLPPWPVIGLGDSAHPLAAELDCVIEPPVDRESVIRTISANPAASAVFVQLLRSTAGIDMATALVRESLAYAALQGGPEHARWLAAHTPPPARPAGTVRLERTEDVLTITICRAHAANAIDVAIRDGLREGFELAVLDETIREVQLRAEGRAFGAGAELAEFGTTRDPELAHALRMASLPAIPASRCAGRLTAQVQGLCIGASLELAAFAHRIEARGDAIFRLGEIAMGILPGAGGTVSVTRRIGRQRTALMVLSGRRIGARTALEWGLIDAIMD